ncbi:MAG: 8-amino-7-oxononanoate synthase [Verrucomicrobiota bacterium]
MPSPESTLAELEALGLRRDLRRIESSQGPEITNERGERLANFSSNDYLGLSQHPALIEASAAAVREFGVGAGASRLVCGSLAPHHQLEAALAEFKRTEAALTFSSGFAVATGVIPAVCGKDDVVILDKLAHACLIDGARLSGAKMRVFPHNDLDRLERHLKWARQKFSAETTILIVTESIFSMDGDRAPLREIFELKDRFGASLLLDEAHAFGLLGPRGRGLAAECDIDSRVELQMGTFSKAAGVSGGYLCASKPVIDLLINRARSFIYSTAPPPAIAATLSKSLELVDSEEGDKLRDKLHSNRQLLEIPGISPIAPLVIGENEPTLAASNDLRASGFLVPAIRYPTVPRGTARLRVTVSAAHEAQAIENLNHALANCVFDRQTLST